MPYKILTCPNGHGKYYLTEMDYRPTEAEIYKQEAIQAERFRLAYGNYFCGDRRAREILRH